MPTRTALETASSLPRPCRRSSCTVDSTHCTARETRGASRTPPRPTHPPATPRSTRVATAERHRSTVPELERRPLALARAHRRPCDRSPTRRLVWCTAARERLPTHLERCVAPAA